MINKIFFFLFCFVTFNGLIATEVDLSSTVTEIDAKGKVKPLEKDKEIVVKVNTEGKVKPLYLAEIELKSKAITDKYAAELKKILYFDLHHNGLTEVIDSTFPLKSQNEEDKLNQSFNHEAWKKLGINYVIRPSLKESKLSVSLFIVGKKEWGISYSCSLSGKIEDDRASLHRLSDRIQMSFFGQQGIASTSILYIKRNRKKAGKHYKRFSEVWECDYDGARPRQITYDGDYCVTPSYIPPQKGKLSGNLFYVSYKQKQPKIFIASRRDRSSQRFSSLRGNQLMPVISRQRDKVAFICNIAGRADLFLQAFNPVVGCIGKPKQIFSAYRATQASPTFSSDGKQIAFVSNKDGSPRIYLMDVPKFDEIVKEPKAKLLTKKYRENTCPVWSPDGKKIAYSAKISGTRQICMYDFTTKEEIQLTSGPQNKENPTWAPNSLHIIFNTTETNNSDLHLMNINQPSVVLKITDGKGEKCFPAWEPR